MAFHSFIRLFIGRFIHSFPLAPARSCEYRPDQVMALPAAQGALEEAGAPVVRSWRNRILEEQQALTFPRDSCGRTWVLRTEWEPAKSGVGRGVGGDVLGRDSQRGTSSCNRTNPGRLEQGGSA